MRSHAAAIAWEFRKRHRWGFTAVAAYLLVLVTFRILLLARGQEFTFDDEQSFAFAVVVPLTSTFMYFLAVFSFGLSGDLAARESIYPSRKFTLPVSSAALAGWPILYGAVAMAGLWLPTRFLLVNGFGEGELHAFGWPSGVDVPLIWPAVFAAAILAWTQALMWMPYALPGLRVVVTVMWLPMIDIVVFLALYYKASEPVMLALLVPHVPVAFLVARSAVSKARRGDVPDWRGFFALPGWIANVVRQRPGHFRSPADAQLWFEWRLHGRSLPILVGILLPFELSMLFLFRDTPVIVFETLTAVLLTPPFMAVFVAATVGKSNASGGDSYGVTPFIGARPLTSASLIAAKLKVTIWSTLATWMLVIVAILIAMSLSGTLPLLIEWEHSLRGAIGMPRVTVVAFFVFAGLLASTWKQLVQSLCVRLSGRVWIIKGSVFLALSLLAVIVPVVQWTISKHRLLATIWKTFPLILAILVIVKLFAAAWIALRLYDAKIFRERTLVIGAACWAASVFALYGVSVWFFSTRIYVFLLVAILAIPLARLSAAPLALAWNRHR